MKQIVWKAYWNYEKEEKWLNEMAAKGLALTDYSWCRYVFEEAPPGEYIYRIEFLKNNINHPESRAYIRFVEETGAQMAASYMNWVYFRKKAANGPFDIFSDLTSRIGHYVKVRRYWDTLMAIEFAAGAINLTVGGLFWFMEGEFTINVTLGLILTVMGVLFAIIGTPLRRKIRALRREKLLRE